MSEPFRSLDQLEEGYKRYFELLDFLYENYPRVYKEWRKIKPD